MNAVMHPTIALLQTSSLTMVVQQEIERAILVGEYAPGSKLNEATLAEKLGVSRGPVREAFRMLDEAGPGAHREEPRRVRARHPDRRGDRDLRPARRDGRAGRPPLAEHHGTAAQGDPRAWCDAMEKAVKADDTHSTTC
jgi:DNA-binding GntR family transcriptional regulator